MRRGLSRIVSAMLSRPRAFKEALRPLPALLAALDFAGKWKSHPRPKLPGIPAEAAPNPLFDAFRANETGRGMWKWEHYFEIYQRHLGKFAGRDVHALEIGIFSGGSLGMWKRYFGPGSTIHGVDIQEACRAYEEPGFRIHIGDQGDRAFWRAFHAEVSELDVVIDDGSHQPEHQITTLEELLPRLRPGGVYICEDIHGIHNEFAAYVNGLSRYLNETREIEGPTLTAQPNAFQQDVQAVHVYPFAIVIEKTAVPRERLIAPRQGTEWLPFRP